LLAVGHNFKGPSARGQVPASIRPLCAVVDRLRAASTLTAHAWVRVHPPAKKPGGCRSRSRADRRWGNCRRGKRTPTSGWARQRKCCPSSSRDGTPVMIRINHGRGGLLGVRLPATPWPGRPAGAPRGHPPRVPRRRRTVVTWLILPVVICLSQRLSHACLSISNLYSETANGSLNQLSFI
jgi:hypothetical protein